VHQSVANVQQKWLAVVVGYAEGLMFFVSLSLFAVHLMLTLLAFLFTF